MWALPCLYSVLDGSVMRCNDMRMHKVNLQLEKQTKETITSSPENQEASRALRFFQSDAHLFLLEIFFPLVASQTRSYFCPISSFHNLKTKDKTAHLFFFSNSLSLPCFALQPSQMDAFKVFKVVQVPRNWNDWWNKNENGRKCRKVLQF